MSAYVTTLTDICYGYLARGCREEKSNRGVCVDEIKRLYGDSVPLDEPWCAQFAYVTHLLTCLRLNERVKLPKSKAVAVMLSQSQKVLRVDGRPEPGDVFARKAGTGNHAGCVITVDSQGILTVEGNTSNKVGARRYSWEDIESDTYRFRFIHLAEAYASAITVRRRLEFY